jgi:CsoR family transcriptional regulator, copper-sensing transcriptional repressor
LKNRSSKKDKPEYHEHTKQLPRLKRIEGQVRGLQQMIENERNCVEIAHQINAVIAALRRVQSDMLREHILACSQTAIAGNVTAVKAKRLADEVGALMAKWG